jgi:hypothetical protein
LCPRTHGLSVAPARSRTACASPTISSTRWMDRPWRCRRLACRGDDGASAHAKPAGSVLVAPRILTVRGDKVLLDGRSGRPLRRHNWGAEPGRTAPPWAVPGRFSLPTVQQRMGRFEITDCDFKTRPRRTPVATLGPLPSMARSWQRRFSTAAGLSR